MAVLSLGLGLLVLAAGFSATTYSDWYYDVDCAGRVSAERIEQLQVCYWDGPSSWTSNCSSNGSLIFRTYFHDPEPVAPAQRCLGKPTNVTKIVTGVCAPLAGPSGPGSSRYACKADDGAAAEKTARQHGSVARIESELRQHRGVRDPAAGKCTTDVDCQLLGACVDGRCTCDLGWTGETCGSLKLGKSTQIWPSINDSGVSASWGASILPEVPGAGFAANAGTYHLFTDTVCRADSCAHSTSAQIVHSVSTTGVLGQVTTMPPNSTSVPCSRQLAPHT